MLTLHELVQSFSAASTPHSPCQHNKLLTVATTRAVAITADCTSVRTCVDFHGNCVTRSARSMHVRTEVHAGNPLYVFEVLSLMKTHPWCMATPEEEEWFQYNWLLLRSSNHHLLSASIHLHLLQHSTNQLAPPPPPPPPPSPPPLPLDSFPACEFRCFQIYLRHLFEGLSVWFASCFDSLVPRPRPVFRRYLSARGRAWERG